MTQELLLWDIAKEIKVSTIREALTLTLIFFTTVKLWNKLERLLTK